MTLLIIFISRFDQNHMLICLTTGHQPFILVQEIRQSRYSGCGFLTTTKPLMFILCAVNVFFSCTHALSWKANMITLWTGHFQDEGSNWLMCPPVHSVWCWTTENLHAASQYLRL